MTRFFLLLAMAASSAGAQTLILKDGRAIEAQALRRDGDVLMATQNLPGAAGQSARRGEFGYSLSQIDSVVFDEPKELAQARALLLAGKPADAVNALQKPFAYFDRLGDIPGSWWGPLMTLRIDALRRAGRFPEASAQADIFAKKASQAETKQAAQVAQAYAAAQQGDLAKAAGLYDAVLSGSVDSALLAEAALGKGEVLMAQKRWAPALLTLLQVPVFHSQETLYMPRALLAAVRSYVELEDFDRARAVIDQIKSQYADTPEAKAGEEQRIRVEKLARGRGKQ